MCVCPEGYKKLGTIRDVFDLIIRTFQAQDQFQDQAMSVRISTNVLRIQMCAREEVVVLTLKEVMFVSVSMGSSCPSVAKSVLTRGWATATTGSLEAGVT